MLGGAALPGCADILVVCRQARSRYPRLLLRSSHFLSLISATRRDGCRSIGSRLAPRSRRRQADIALVRVGRVKDIRAALIEQARETHHILPATQFALTEQESGDFAKKGSRYA
jgi:hypothetical protein